MWTHKFSISSVFLAILSLANTISVKRENSITAPYTVGSQTLVFWDLIGSAQLGGAYARLTTDEPEKKGGIWNNFPCVPNNWEIQTYFHIHGKGVNLNGDGMAIWYVRDPLHTGPVFGYKDNFSGLGVFIDTFENQREPHKHRHPYISAMVNNGSLHYEHDEDGTMTQIGGCAVPIRNLEVPTKIAVSYIGDTLSVYLDHEGLNQWRPCFKALGVHLPTGYYIGVTASTSDLSDNHDVISVTSLSLDHSDKEWEDRSDIIPEAENVQIPLKYHKQAMEEDKQKQQKVEQQKRAQKIEQKREIKEDDDEEDSEDDDEEDDTSAEEISPSSTSLLTKLIYITGAVIIIFVAISTYRKYSERKRERMQKRLF